MAALLPKCPVCVAVYLSAAGIGAGVAQDTAPWVIRATNGVAAAVLSFLGFRLVLRAWRSRHQRRLGVWALSVGSLLVLSTRGWH